MAFKAEVGMTVFKKDVLFTFSGSDGGFMGEITFPDKFHIGDVMEGIWTAIEGNLDSYPFGKIDIEIERITALMKEDKPNNQSLILWSIIVGGIQVTVYFINDTETKKQTKAFCIEPKGGIVIDSVPGINAKLPNPITAAPKMYLADKKVSFTIAGQQYNLERGLTAEMALDIPTVFKDKLSYTYTPKKKSGQGGERGLSRDASGGDVPKPPAGVKWKKVDKKLGKFATIHRVGYLYKDKKVSLHLDMDAKLAVIEVGLINLQLQLDTTKFSMFKDFGKSKNKFTVIKDFLGEAISFGLDGLGIGIETKAFTLAGILYRDKVIINKTINGKLTPVEYNQYIGGLVIKTSAFTAAGIGAYGKIDGYKSFFVYIFLGVPIGGPIYFSVQGLALGFGYNRQVKIPDIEHVADFPFIRLAMGNPDPNVTVMSTLTKMVPIIVDTFPPQEGSLFFAVGVKFNSFKMLDGFVLLLVTIGEKLRIDVLGVLVLIKPKDKPVIVVELAIKVTIIPSTGVISVEGRITDNSYLFSKDAKLQGGFAFFVWSKDINVNGYDITAGEFVLTIGGYHPQFNKPGYYPAVPRFGLNWRVTDNFTVKALAYFALTPVSIMAGLEISANYSSKKLTAWFKLWADFLIQWSPFYYDISAGISLGYEYKTWIKTIRGELSASIHVWGPEFSGKAKIKVCCFSKTISFGSGQLPATPKISWFAFKKELLNKTILTSKMLDGMISEGKEGKDTVYQVDPKSCAFTIESVIPISSISGVNLQSGSGDGAFNIYPVAKQANAKVKVTITNLSGGSTDQFEASLSTKNQPMALWSNKYALGLNEDKTTIAKPVQLILKAKPPTNGIHVPIAKVPPFEETQHQDMWGGDTLGKLKEIPKTRFGVFQEEYEETVDVKGSIATYFGLRATPILIRN